MPQIKFTANKDFRSYTEGDTRTIPLLDKEVTFIVGKNGSGKSTLLHCIRATKHSLYDTNKKERDGMQSNDDILFKDGGFCSIEGLDIFDNVFVLDSVDDDPLSFINSATGTSYINGGGIQASRMSNGQKSMSMLARFIHKIEDVCEFNIHKYDAGEKCPTRNLVIFDEVDEGLDIGTQKKFAVILKNLSALFNASTICVTHNAMLPMMYGGKDAFVYDIIGDKELKISEYIKNETELEL